MTVNEDDQRDKVRAKIAASRNMTGKEPTPSYVAGLLAEHGLPSSDTEVAAMLGKTKGSKSKAKTRTKEVPQELEPAQPVPPKTVPVVAASQQLVLVDCQTELPSVTLEEWLARALEDGSLRWPGQPIVLKAGQEELARTLARLGALVVRGTR